MAAMPRVANQLVCVVCMLMTCSLLALRVSGEVKKIVKSQFKIGREDVNDLMHPTNFAGKL